MRLVLTVGLLYGCSAAADESGAIDAEAPWADAVQEPPNFSGSEGETPDAEGGESPAEPDFDSVADTTGDATADVAAGSDTTADVGGDSGDATDDVRGDSATPDTASADTDEPPDDTRVPLGPESCNYMDDDGDGAVDEGYPFAVLFESNTIIDSLGVEPRPVLAHTQELIATYWSTQKGGDGGLFREWSSVGIASDAFALGQGGSAGMTAVGGSWVWVESVAGGECGSGCSQVQGSVWPVDAGAAPDLEPWAEITQPLTGVFSLEPQGNASAVGFTAVPGAASSGGVFGGAFSLSTGSKTAADVLLFTKSAGESVVLTGLPTADSIYWLSSSTQDGLELRVSGGIDAPHTTWTLAEAPANLLVGLGRPALVDDGVLVAVVEGNGSSAVRRWDLGSGAEIGSPFVLTGQLCSSVAGSARDFMVACVGSDPPYHSVRRFGVAEGSTANSSLFSQQSPLVVDADDTLYGNSGFAGVVQTSTGYFYAFVGDRVADHVTLGWIGCP